MDTTATQPDRWADLVTPGTVPDGFIAWLDEEVDKAEAFAEKLRLEALHAMYDGHSGHALIDAEARADGMAKAFRAAACKARAMQRRAAKAAEPKPEPVTKPPASPPAEPVIILGAAVADGHFGVLVQQGADRSLLLPDGRTLHLKTDAERINDVSPAMIDGLLRQHDEARNALDGAA